MLHVLFLPLTMLVLMGLHFWRIRKDGGLSRPYNADELILSAEGLSPEKINELKKSGDRSIEKVWSWPYALWAELAVLMLTIAVLFLIAILVDAPLREPANPAIPENPAKSPWYFLGIQELVSYSAFTGGILVPLGFIAFLVSIPFKDRESEHAGLWFSGRTGLKNTGRSALFALFSTAALLFFTIRAGRLRDWFPGLPQLLIIFINPATLITLIYVLWSMLVFRSTKSTRQAALAIFTCAMIGYIIYTIVGVYFRGPNWEFYWLKSMWPLQ